MKNANRTGTWSERIRPGLLISACLASTIPLASQSPAASEIVDYQSPDGSRFLLVPTGGAPVIHWVMATPAGVLEDPAGFEGLSFAVARAAMFGTNTQSSLDVEKEIEALSEQDRLEQQWDSTLSRGLELDDEKRMQTERARAQALGLSDGIAWERSLRQAPTLGTRLVQIPEANLLHIVTSVEGLPTVAKLLVERREGSLLRGVHRAFRLVRAEQQRRRGSGPQAAMRREVLGLSFLGHPFSRAYAPTPLAPPISRAQALSQFRRTHHPERTLHVLTGGFDPAEVQRALTAAFVQTALAQPLVAPTPAVAAVTAARRSSIGGGHHQAITIGFRIPPDADRDTLSVLVLWLTHGLDAELAKRLRVLGHPDVVVAGTAPFPIRTSGLFLLEIDDPAATRPGQELANATETALAAVIDEGPRSEDLERALRRFSAVGATSRLGAESLALEMAIACGVENRDPASVLETRGEVSPDDVVRLARQLLARDNRTMVLLEVDS